MSYVNVEIYTGSALSVVTNHGEPLNLDNVQLTQRKGVSPCPVSGVLFGWEQDVDSSVQTVDKFGNVTIEKSFNVEDKKD
jgi:hypothetical protein